MASPRISVIMVDGSFREHFHSIRFFADQTQSPDDYELLWVEYYQEVRPELRAEIEKYPNFKIITLGNDPDTVYHSSYCFNAGIVAARGELLVIPDADVAVTSDFLERVWDEHQTNEKLVMYIYRYDEPENLHQPNWTLDDLERHCVLKSATNHGGCVTVRKKWMLEINGYEQHPVFGTGFHGNGRYNHQRFKAFGLPIMWHPTIKIYHPWHPGTTFSSSQYKLQRIIMGYQELHIEYLPFEGIDPTKNHPLPEMVEERIVETNRSYQRSLNDRLRKFVRERIYVRRFF